MIQLLSLNDCLPHFQRLIPENLGHAEGAEGQGAGFVVWLWCIGIKSLLNLGHGCNGMNEGMAFGSAGSVRFF